MSFRAIALAIVACVCVLGVTTHTRAHASNTRMVCAAYDTERNVAYYNVGTRVRIVRPLGEYEDEWRYARNVPRIVSRITFNWPVRPHRGVRFACSIGGK